MVEISEAEIKYAILEWLQYKQNAGELYFDRLNSGAVTVARGYAKYKIQLCREGTADLIVLKSVLLWDGVHATRIPSVRVIFLEIKNKRRKQRPEQEVFQELIEAQGAEYWVVRSVEEVIEIIG